MGTCRMDDIFEEARRNADTIMEFMTLQTPHMF